MLTSDILKSNNILASEWSKMIRCIEVSSEDAEKLTSTSIFFIELKIASHFLLKIDLVFFSISKPL